MSNKFLIFIYVLITTNMLKRIVFTMIYDLISYVQKKKMNNILSHEQEKIYSEPAHEPYRALLLVRIS